MIYSKKGLLGSEFVLWFLRFFVILLIVAGFFLMVYAVRERNYDVRETEISLIQGKIIDCIADKNNGEISSARIEKFQDCVGIDENEIYIILSVFNATKEIEKGEFGRKELKIYCDMPSSVKQKYPLECLRQRYLITFDDGFKQTAYLNMSIAYANFGKNV